jgi:hypothetical protein
MKKALKWSGIVFGVMTVGYALLCVIVVLAPRIYELLQAAYDKMADFKGFYR